MNLDGTIEERIEAAMKRSNSGEGMLDADERNNMTPMERTEIMKEIAEEDRKSRLDFNKNPNDFIVSTSFMELVEIIETAKIHPYIELDEYGVFYNYLTSNNDFKIEKDIKNIMQGENSNIEQLIKVLRFEVSKGTFDICEDFLKIYILSLIQIGGSYSIEK